MKDGIIIEESNRESNISFEENKKRIISKDYFKSLIQKSIFISMILFGIVTLFELVNFVIDISIYIKNLIDPPLFTWYERGFQYMGFYYLIPFLGLILIFFGIVKEIQPQEIQTQTNWLMIGRMFFISGLIFIILIAIQVINRYFPLSIGFKILEVGPFGYEYQTYDLSLIIYAIGFVFIFTGLFLLRKEFYKSIKIEERKKTTFNVFLIVLAVIESLHIFGFVVLDSIRTQGDYNDLVITYFICSIVLYLTPLTYTVITGYIFKYIKPQNSNKNIS